MDYLSEPPEVLVVCEYDETKTFADQLIVQDVDVRKLPLDCKLRDGFSITYDEVKIGTQVVVVDSFDGALIAQQSIINNAKFFFIDLKKNDKDEMVKQLDFFVVEVKDVSRAKKDDWKGVATAFKEVISKSVDSNSVRKS